MKKRGPIEKRSCFFPEKKKEKPANPSAGGEKKKRKTPEGCGKKRPLTKEKKRNLAIPATEKENTKKANS